MTKCSPIRTHVNVSGNEYDVIANASGNAYDVTTAAPWGPEAGLPAYNSANETGHPFTTTFPNAPEDSAASLINAEQFLQNKIYVGIAALGILGNILNLLVLTRRSLQRTMESPMEKSANIGLMSLAVSDFLFCIAVLPHACVAQVPIFRNVGFDLIYTTYGSGVLNVFIMSSTWLTVFMAVSRYMAICHPIKARNLINVTFSKICIIVIFVLCVLFNLPRFWFHRILGPYPCGEGYSVFFLATNYGTVGPYGSHPKYYTAYMWCYFVICILIPLIILGVCNEFLIRALNQSAKMRQECTRNRDNSMASKNIVTRTLVAIVIFYIILVVPAEVLNFVKTVIISPEGRLSIARLNLAVASLNMLQAVNFAFNFVLYCVTNVFFRRTVREMIMCRLAATHKALMSRGESMTTYYSNITGQNNSNGRSLSSCSKL